MSTNARFYLSHDTKITFNMRFSHQNVRIENAFLWTSTYNVTKRVQLICIMHDVITVHSQMRRHIIKSI